MRRQNERSFASKQSGFIITFLSMAEVFHRYVPSPKKPDEAKEKATLSYLRERERAARAKRMESEIRIAEKQKLLISRELARKQAAYLLISLRQRLLAIPSYVTRDAGMCR